MTKYEEGVCRRTTFRYLIGLLARLRLRFKMDVRLARMRRYGAVVGKTSVVGEGMRFSGFSNLSIGEHCILQSGFIDTRSRVSIGNNVIIGEDVSVLTCSHDIDSTEWEFKSFGIEIEEYVWIATGAKVLPGCRRIGRGAVVGAYAVVASDVPPMAVVVGNPAKIVRYRKCVHESIVPESLHGGDLSAYRLARKRK